MVLKCLAGLLALALCVASGVARPGRAAAQTPTPTPPPVAPKPPALPYKAVPGPRPAEGWQRYEFGASPFASVALPARHETHSEFLPVDANAAASAYSFSGETDDGLYMAYIVENLPVTAERMSEKFREGFYDGALDGLIGAMRKELEKNGVMFKLEMGRSKPVRVGRLEAREQDFTLGPLRGRARTVALGNRVFLVVLMETGETFSVPGLAFLDSLEIRAAR